MKKLLIAAVCGLMALPTVSVADDDHHGWPAPYYRHDDRHDHDGGYRYYGYRAPYYPYYYGHDHHHSNDDALWAIGGLMVGAIIASAVQQSAAPPPAAVAVQPPVRRVQTCYDDIVYDPVGNPHVQRHCYQGTAP